MKKIITLSALLLAVAFTFSACNKEKQLNKRLVGTWNIDNVSGSVKIQITGFPDQTQTINSSNTGTFIFNSDGTGKDAQNADITWTNTDETVSITTKSNNQTMTWTVSSNEKTKQTWVNKSTVTQSTGGISSTTIYDLTTTLSKK